MRPSVASQAASGCLKGILIFILLIGGLVAFVVFNQHHGEAERTQRTQQNSPAEKFVSADELISAYSKNEVAADSEFKSKRLSVSGKVNSVGKDILDQPYVTLEAGSNTFRQVQCFFDHADEGRLAALKPGDFVTIDGDCDGLMANVLLKNCQIQR